MAGNSTLTPLPEEIAAAERIADSGRPHTMLEWAIAKEAALAAFMEAREKTVRHLEKQYGLPHYGIGVGEHLR